MKIRISVLCLLSAVVCLLNGCDMFRSMAGRPTSEDLAVMRSEMESRKADEIARIEYQERKQARQRDSLAAVRAAEDTLKMMGGLLRSPSKLGGLSKPEELNSKYYAVLGSFKEHSNADKYMKRIKEAGYSAELIHFKSGLTSVGACAGDDPSLFLSQIGKLKSEAFCPKDFWILVNE